MKICFLGAGKIATAITCGLIRKGVFRPNEVVATDIFEDAAKAFTEATHCECVTDIDEAIKDADAVVLSVKPQDSKELLQKLHGRFQGKLFISVAAGLPLDKLQEWTGTDRVIRVTLPDGNNTLL